MVKLKQRGLKWLHLVHILTASAWFGMVASIFVLALTCYSYESKEAFLSTASMILKLYSVVQPPIVLFIFVQGLVYGIFTNWGFFKHKWILAKWILWPFLMALTNGFALRELEGIIDNVNSTGLIPDGKDIILYIALQLVILIVVFLLPVFKPMKKKKQNLETKADTSH